MRDQWQRSNPDIQVFIPGRDAYEGDNEHFLVFEASDGTLLALWTQSSCEGFGDNHLVIARSADGLSWSPPAYVAGSLESGLNSGKGSQASWGFPVVADTGRIYVFYTKDTGKYDLDSQTTGAMGCCYSDDNGHSFIPGGDIAIPKNPYDSPDPDTPPNWIAWQIPIRDSRGRFITGYTRWSSPCVMPEKTKGWFHRDSRVHFMRFTNLHLGVDPAQLIIEWLPEQNKGLVVPHPTDEGVSVAQEPSLVLLADQRLFCVFRTITGHIWYSLSEDDGASWQTPLPLRYCDNGAKICQPIASCPVYPMADGRYLLVFHNNNGYFDGYEPKDVRFNRRPAFIATGTYMPDAAQPIWFSKPVQILDTGGIPVGPKGTTEIATYPSFTETFGRRVLWYPDRKYFLLGKIITDEMLNAQT